MTFLLGRAMFAILTPLIFKSWAHLKYVVCVCMLVTQSCPTLCDPMDYNSAPPPMVMNSWARILG